MTFQIYSNFHHPFSRRKDEDFYALVTVQLGNDPGYRFELKYGNVYLKKK
ncbi:MAG: hypothetical protein ACK5TU_09535 [Cyclobacteriaceae bacterium]|jgi:hypothetical protein